MELLIATALLFIAFLAASALWSSKNDRATMQDEAVRCLQENCELDKSWHSRGRVYTKGLALIEQSGQLRFVEQAKLCDVGLLK